MPQAAGFSWRTRAAGREGSNALIPRRLARLDTGSSARDIRSSLGRNFWRRELSLVPPYMPEGHRDGGPPSPVEVAA